MESLKIRWCWCAVWNSTFCPLVVATCGCHQCPHRDKYSEYTSVTGHWPPTPHPSYFPTTAAIPRHFPHQHKHLESGYKNMKSSRNYPIYIQLFSCVNSNYFVSCWDIMLASGHHYNVIKWQGRGGWFHFSPMQYIGLLEVSVSHDYKIWRLDRRWGCCW